MFLSEVIHVDLFIARLLLSLKLMKAGIAVEEVS